MKSYLFAPAPLVLAAAVAAFSGCDTNQSGDLSTTKFGDLTHALLEGERGDALAALTDACGVSAPERKSKSPLRRRPYWQQVTHRSATLLWTAHARMQSAVLVASRPDGSVVAMAKAVEDRSARTAPLVQWNAALTDLEPDTTYCYELMSSGDVLRRGGFRTAPLSHTGRPVRFVALGDSGEGSADQRAVYKQLLKVPFDLVLHMGDIAYDSGTRAQLENYFFQMYPDMLELFPIFPASGNHEYETEGAAPFREAFSLPENGGPGGLERWYSYDWGNVHFVVLDTELIGPEQADWLDADLMANRLPWTIVYMHRPPFSSGDHGNDVNVQLRFVPLFVKHKVPLVLSGHDHHYERTHTLDGVTYVVTGGGGRGTRGVGHSPFTAFSERVCNFVYGTVVGDQLTLHAIDGVGQEFDSLRLSR
jgi:acid phosphatase type 7